MAGVKSNFSSKNSNKLEQQSTPIETRHRAAERRRGITGNSSGSSAAARSSSICCTDSFELLEKKLLNNIYQVINDKFGEVQDCLASKTSEIMDMFKTEIRVLQGTFDHLQDEISSLKESIEQFKRQQRLSDAVVTGVPFTTSEEPVEIVKTISGIVGAALPSQTFAFRAQGSKSKNRPIIIKFPTASDQKLFLSKYRSKGPVRLHQISSRFTSNTNVGVYESLTDTNHRILREALFLRRKHRLQSVITRNGLVYVKRDSESRWLKVSDIALLDQFSSEVQSSDAGAVLVDIVRAEN